MTATLSLDENMLNAYKEGKDLYAIIAQSVFDNKYEDNLEFFPAGTELELDGQKIIAGNKTHLNKAGKERRSVGKTLLLASTYGMSGRTAGIRMQKSAEEGNELLTNFFNGFPKVKKAIDDSKEFLKEHGYVEDFLGRRRRLTDINIDPYEARTKTKQTGVNPNFNPLFGCGYRKSIDDPVAIWTQVLEAYVILANVHRLSKNINAEVSNEMSNYKFDELKKLAAKPELLDAKIVFKNNFTSNKSQQDKIIEDLVAVARLITERHYKNGSTDYYIEPQKDLDRLLGKYQTKYGTSYPRSIPRVPMVLYAWTGRIAQAERQCFNARIQGSAASLTKLAMVDIYNDEVMNRCQAKLIIPVHDELLVECPEEYADIVEKRLPEVMINAAAKHITEVGMKCDPYNVTRWYADEYAALIQEEFKKLEAGNKDKGIQPMSRDAALATVIKNHEEVPEAAIIKTIETGCDLDF